MFQDYSFQIAFAVFFITLIASRYIILNAMKKLSDTDKAKLLSSKLINQSQTRLLIVFGVLGVYYFAITKYPQYALPLVSGFVIIIIANRVFNFISTRKSLNQLDLPNDYVKAFITGSIIYSLGLITFFILLLKNYF